MSNYKLSIITPQGKIFEDQIESLIAPGAEGFLGVLARHAPIITLLAKGVLEISKNNAKQFFSVGPGMLEVDTQSNCLILTDSAQTATTQSAAADLVKNTK